MALTLYNCHKRGDICCYISNIWLKVGHPAPAVQVVVLTLS